MKKYFSLPLLFLSFFSTCIHAQKVTAVLDTNEIFIGEQTTLRLELSFSAAAEAHFPDIEDSVDKHIPIVEKSAIDTSYAEKDVTTKILSQELLITSFDTGYHPIRPISFAVNGDTISTQAMLLTVKTVPIPQDADIKDIKNILDVPFTIWDWIKLHKWYIFLSIAIIGLIILGLHFYKKYRNQPKRVLEKPKPLLPAHEIAFAKLQELKSKKLWQNSKVKEYHIELSYIVREYLENRYGTNSLDNTTDTILHESRSLELNDDDRQKLTQVLVLADMAKFAKQEPVSHENEQSMKNAEAFIESTKLVESETELLEKEGNKEEK